MGVASLAISVKPLASKIKVIIGSLLIAISAVSPNIDRILPGLLDAKWC